MDPTLARLCSLALFFLLRRFSSSSSSSSSSTTGAIVVDLEQRQAGGEGDEGPRDGGGKPRRRRKHTGEGSCREAPEEHCHQRRRQASTPGVRLGGLGRGAGESEEGEAAAAAGEGRGEGRCRRRRGSGSGSASRSAADDDAGIDSKTLPRRRHVLWARCGNRGAEQTSSGTEASSPRGGMPRDIAQRRRLRPGEIGLLAFEEKETETEREGKNSQIQKKTMGKKQIQKKATSKPRWPSFSSLFSSSAASSFSRWTSPDSMQRAR